MKLFDKFLGRSNDNKIEIENTDQPSATMATSIISKAIAEREYNLSKAIKIPFTDVMMINASLMQLAPTLRTLFSKSKIKNGSLVRVVFPKGVKGNLAVDKTGLALGGIIKDGGGLAQARLVAVDPAMLAAQAAMAAILITINKKLSNIQETQQKILSFLEKDKQAEQQSNLSILTSILEGYKHNWDNAQYLQNQHMKALDIKQSSEKNLNFFQDQIAEEIKKLPALHFDQAVKTAITDLGKLFSSYRMALYLYSFSSFLEVMLLGNFRQAYLDQVAERVQGHNKHYQLQFSECGDMIKKFSSESVETRILAGIGNASKAFGKLIASTPIKEQGPVYEWLQESGDKLLKGNDKKAENAAAIFNIQEQIGSEIFVDSIRNVSKISNQTTDILFDGEALYLASV